MNYFNIFEAILATIIAFCVGWMLLVTFAAEIALRV